MADIVDVLRDMNFFDPEGIRRQAANYIERLRAELKKISREDRSGQSHNHYFARIAELFDSLPESMAGQFLTSEHLRKYALIKSGYADEQFTSFSSEFDATRAAVMLRNVDDCSIVDVKGRVVRRYTAKSQTYKAMGRKDFQRSKEAVLGYIESLVGVNRSDNGEAA